MGAKRARSKVMRGREVNEAREGDPASRMLKR